MLHLSSQWTGGRMQMTNVDESQEADLRWSVRVSGITLADLARHPGLSVPGIGYPLERAEMVGRQ
jgi:hypothetical protein